MIRTTTILCGYLLLLSLFSSAVPVGSFYIKFDWIGGLLVLTFSLMNFFRHKSANPLAFLYVLMFSLYILINALFQQVTATTYDFNGFVSYSLQYLFVLLVFLGIASFKINDLSINRVMNFWVALGVLASLLAIAQYFAGSVLIDDLFYMPYGEDANVTSKVVKFEEGDYFAPPGWFMEASWIGSFLVVPTLFSFTLLFQKDHIFDSLFINILIVSILMTAIILGYSIITLLSIFAGIVTSFFLANRAYNPKYVKFMSILIVGFAAVNIDVVGFQISRFSEIIEFLSDFEPGSLNHGTATSMYVRSVGFAAGISAFLDNVVLGHGIGQSPRPYHSSLITLMAELGVIGVLFLYWLPLYVIKQLFWLKAAIRKSIAKDLLANSLIVCLVGDYVNGTMTHQPFSLFRWFLVSVTFCWIVFEKKLHHIESGKSNEC